MLDHILGTSRRFIFVLQFIIIVITPHSLDHFGSSTKATSFTVGVKALECI